MKKIDKLREALEETTGWLKYLLLDQPDGPVTDRIRAAVDRARDALTGKRDPSPGAPNVMADRIGPWLVEVVDRIKAEQGIKTDVAVIRLLCHKSYPGNPTKRNALVKKYQNRLSVLRKKSSQLIPSDFSG